MKRIAFALGLVAATALAAPAAAQSRNDGPWWDPANTGNRGSVDTRDGRIYNDGRIYDSRSSDGQWRRAGRDRNGNLIYVRNRYDRNGNLVREVARRDSLGRYRVIDRRVVQSANRRNGRYDDRYDYDRNNDGWDDRRRGHDKNDRWDQNNGHDNGKHKGWYKNKNKNKNKGRHG